MSRRNTGFSDEVKAVIRARANDRCERCNDRTSDMQFHHRRPRGMGGTRRADTNTAAAGVLLCGTCHRTVEAHRSQALDDGWLVRQSQNPLEVPVLYRTGRLSLLDSDGFTYPIPTRKEA